MSFLSNYDIGLQTVLNHCNDGCLLELQSSLMHFLDNYPSTEIIDTRIRDRYQNTLLIISATLGYENIVSWLLQQEGILVNSKNMEGSTALISACTNGNGRIVSILLGDIGIDPNLVDNEGVSALSSSISYNEIDIVRKLLSHEGVNRDIQDKSGDTPLYYACYYEYFECVKILLTHSLKAVDPNIRNNDGRIPLFCALAKGNVEISKFLYQFHIKKDLQIQDNEGVSLESLAKELYFKYQR